ncbi:hypothetical protein [Methanobrevibacter sp.]|uniref:hypothetical protein n=1 Tax=Methanobrevibacter sp. TaxID=66852 RepID=UPI0025F47760|nr:hypothetical protein [Methanobrevibacter sp.]MBQ2666184.1 hypothetical protein [Methanobrevibacter sp.]
MSDIFEEIGEIFEIAQDTGIEFKEICGFTFVFKTRTVMFRGKVSAFEMKPLGIIYDENGEYYFAPLYRKVNLEAVVKEYVNYAK